MHTWGSTWRVDAPGPFCLAVPYRQWKTGNSERLLKSYTSETAEDVAAEALAESSRFDAPETGADLGEHVETIEVLPLESEMPGPREASGQGIGDVIETREYEPMPDAPGPVERSAKERARARW